jgi:hypothetical protein
LRRVWSRFQARRGSRGSLGKFSHHHRSIRPGRDLGDQLLELTLGLVDGSFQEPVPILRREVRRQLGDRGQVKTAIRRHRQEHRVLPGRARHRDAKVGLLLGEVKGGPAVDEQRRKGRAGVGPSLVHLGEVSDDVDLNPPRLARQLGQASEQFVVGNRLERSFFLHPWNIGHGISTSGDSASSTQQR